MWQTTSRRTFSGVCSEPGSKIAMSIFLFDAVDLYLEVGLHVVDGDAVLVKKRTRDPLTYPLLVCVGDRFARDVIESLAVLDGIGLVD